jgi:ATP-dependent RNA helicase RhlB
VEWADDDLFVHDFKRVKPRPKSNETRAKGPTHHGRKHPEGEKKAGEGEAKKRRRPRKKPAGEKPKVD